MSKASTIRKSSFFSQGRAPSVAICMAALCLAALSPAWAQTPEADVPEQNVQIVSVRDPAIMPYKAAYETLKKVADSSHGRVRFVIKVTSEKTHAPFTDLEITLQGDKTFEKLAISPEGYLTVPLSQAAYDDHADFLTNKKKGTLRVEFFLVPALAGESFSYADVSSSIESARAALAQILPWYVRLVMPSVKQIGICYPDKTQVVSISGSAEAVRAATAEETDPVTEAKVYCAKFSSSERGLGQESMIAPAGGWVSVYF